MVHLKTNQNVINIIIVYFLYHIIIVIELNIFCFFIYYSTNLHVIYFLNAYFDS